jgi:hypothetical protein
MTEDIIRSRKAIAFPVGVELARSAEGVIGAVSGTSSCAPASAVTARLASRPWLAPSSPIYPQPSRGLLAGPKKGLLTREPQGASQRHIIKDMLPTR